MQKHHWQQPLVIDLEELVLKSCWPVKAKLKGQVLVTALLQASYLGSKSW